jgi:hypothetical protein
MKIAPFGRTASSALCIAIALLIAPQPSPAQTEPYEINAILPLTGSAAFLGQAFLQALKLVEKQTNATGGIHGRPVRFVISDDESSPQTDVQLLAPLIAKHVPVVIDGGPVAMCRAAMPLVANGPVLYCLSPALYPPSGGFAFSTSGSSEDETHARELHARAPLEAHRHPDADRRYRPRIRARDPPTDGVAGESRPADRCVRTFRAGRPQRRRANVEDQG